MVNLIDDIELDNLKITENIKLELDRFRKFSYIFGQNSNLKSREVDVKNYAKYVLLEGTKEEKRELLGCLRGEVVLKNKILFIA